MELERFVQASHKLLSSVPLLKIQDDFVAFADTTDEILTGRISPSDPTTRLAYLLENAGRERMEQKIHERVQQLAQSESMKPCNHISHLAHSFPERIKQASQEDLGTQVFPQVQCRVVDAIANLLLAQSLFIPTLQETYYKEGFFKNNPYLKEKALPNDTELFLAQIDPTLMEKILTESGDSFLAKQEELMLRRDKKGEFVSSVLKKWKAKEAPGEEDFSV